MLYKIVKEDLALTHGITKVILSNKFAHNTLPFNRVCKNIKQDFLLTTLGD